MELGSSEVQANFTALGEPAKLTLTVNDQGMLERVKFDRWGNPGGGECHYVDFGGIIEESGTFDGYTIRMKALVRQNDVYPNVAIHNTDADFAKSQPVYGTFAGIAAKNAV